MSWTVIWTAHAHHDLRRLDRAVAIRFIRAVERLANVGLGDVRPLQGSTSEWRLRVGEWRVRFTYDRAKGAIEVLRVLPRGRAYRD